MLVAVCDMLGRSLGGLFILAGFSAEDRFLFAAADVLKIYYPEYSENRFG